MHSIARKTDQFYTKLTNSLPIHHSTHADNVEVDALIVGAGFAGIYMLKTLRERGYKAVIFDAAEGIGGAWRWNCYPGAAVDSEVPQYEFSWPEVWKTWNWKTNYPNYTELRAYFDHVDKVLDIRKDCSLNTVIVGAKFDTERGVWNVGTKDGRTAIAKNLILATGVSARQYVPDWPGMDKFKGTIYHSSFWPEDEIDVRGKKCAVIGTGASGVQVIQNWGPKAGELKVFQRTPNMALPMGRRDLGVEEQEAKKMCYPELFKYRETSFAGFHYDWNEKNTFDDPADVREALYEKAWAGGGFRFWLSTYKDTLINPEANKEAYKFWAKKVGARVEDARKRELLAPRDMPHYFGIKRPCLEMTYYDQFNLTEDGTHYELDVIAVATGFEIVTGGMTQLGLQSINNTLLSEEWAQGAKTYLGTTVSGYPNMFHLYGPQSPTIFSNGLSSIEPQGRWVADCMGKMSAKRIKYINPTQEAAKGWKEHITELTNMTLFPTTNSTYMGGSHPQKVSEPVCYAGGIPAYMAKIRGALDALEGFEVVYEEEP
ncbi:hypothetical protein XA68_11772 [Ophiocordyceps unilateralis]|uniref:FAD/NAD(P)-binding domain-containing protein n=1 Tax=Ophiocordyceps unilateralis TaxID=268505 RepID=A0A2A9PG12_OPHUN|nr:hypothetical protein XA68_11772 [Ophiocordyceps unilateralis]